MEIPAHKNLLMLAHEAFIRRASKFNYPFMLKGSYVTRQYFPDPNDRIPADIDWVYLEKLNDINIAKEVFNNWVTEITELELNDGVKFRSFKENEFWRRIDYAMSEDFPTINTDIKCWVNETLIDFSLDISFNLEIEQPPIPLTYKPIQGEPFIVLNTVHLALQISWKIHQTLVRPRFKDLFDLMYLVQHNSFNEKILTNSIQALTNECKKDKINLKKTNSFFTYEIPKLFPNNSIDKTWNYWRHNIELNDFNRDIILGGKAEYITDISKLPDELSVFLSQFKTLLEDKGFNIDLINNIEVPSKPLQLTEDKMSLWDKIKKKFN